jgi:hypothetical protein
MMYRKLMRYNNYRTLQLIFFIFILLTMLVISTSCEPIAPFKITNQTDQTLTIFIEDFNIGDIAPGKEIENKIVMMMTMTNEKYHIEARDKEGTLVYSKRFTWQESFDMDWKITISPASDNCTLNE